MTLHLDLHMHRDSALLRLVSDDNARARGESLIGEAAISAINKHMMSF
jgi:hypothetical protein